MLLVMGILRLPPIPVSKLVSHPKQALKDAKGSREAPTTVLTNFQPRWSNFLQEAASAITICKSSD